ncbi:MAG: neutral zinc metallopeptidase [Bdellovibrionales bacterium]|nr:neutral zinc metallopeptidase [Bdellovibrionales bacterium]
MSTKFPPWAARLVAALILLTAVPAQADLFQYCQDLLLPPRNAFTDGRVEAAFARIQEYWRTEFIERGWPYEPARLVLHSGVVDSACGALRNLGPIYCGLDTTVYIDLAYFTSEWIEMFGPPDLALLNYVLAHELGHHVQFNRRPHLFSGNHYTRSEMIALVPRVEMQADCLAGVYLHYAVKNGDVRKSVAQKAPDLAYGFGDDVMDLRSLGRGVQPKKTEWEHGSGVQRSTWLSLGLTSGDLTGCEP